MRNRINRIVTQTASILLGCSIAFSQGGFNKNVRDNIVKIEKEKEKRTSDENKLLDGLYDILKLSEESDTSAAKKIQFIKRLQDWEILQADSNERILIVLQLLTPANIDPVVDTITALDGSVVEVGKTVPFIVCQIHPCKLRNLISLFSIESIRPPAVSETREEAQ